MNKTPKDYLEAFPAAFPVAAFRLGGSVRFPSAASGKRQEANLLTASAKKQKRTVATPNSDHNNIVCVCVCVYTCCM